MEPRKTNVALILSAIFPGLGQFYNQEYVKGVVFLLTGLGLGWMSSEMLPPLDALLAGKTPEGVGQFVGITFLFLGCYAYSIVDAYRSAKRSTAG